MPTRVFYHHPDDKQFSLDFVTPDIEVVGERAVNYESDVSLKVEAYELDRTVYVVYTARGADGAADAIEYDLVEDIDPMKPVNSIIATRLVDLYRNILEENYEQEGQRVQAYKDIVVEDIGRALDQVDWNGTATDVAGRLVSNLILKHSLPNANHRTSIGMAQFYLRRIEPEFSMPKTARLRDGEDEYDWMEWVNDYIRQSKRLLTVRRKGDRFRYLAEFGCDVVERKHGIEIRLDDYELDVPPSERWKRYAEEHEALWIQFIEDAVCRTDTDALLDRESLSKHEFADELKELE